jgi:hypothetical protein
MMKLAQVGPRRSPLSKRWRKSLDTPSPCAHTQPLRLARKDINRLLSHHGLITQSISSPPILFDEFFSSEEEAPVTPKHISSEDEESLSAKL